MRIATQEIAWLAGLLEGEGSFLYTGGNNCQIKVSMTDRDVVAHAAALFGKNVYGPYSSKGRLGKKPCYATYAISNYAAGWMMTLFSFMGQRRQEKIKAVLQLWRRARRYNPGGSALCHPTRPYSAKGYCKSCYSREYQRALRTGRKVDGLCA